jgi:hypothetical protein
VSKLGGADQAISGTGERRANQQNVGYLEEFIESIWCSDPAHSLIRLATSVDGMHRIPMLDINRPIAAPMPPKPRIPQTPASMRLRVN